MFRTVYDKIRLLFVKDKESYLRLYKLLGFYPRRLLYYKMAFRHRSFRNHKGITVNNERLEFLGDAVLDAVVADILFRKFKKFPEGNLTNIRSKIVQRETLNKLALKIGLKKYLQISSPILTHNYNIYGNALEALIGAIYMDLGYKKCIEFFEKQILGKYINLSEIVKKETNFKSHMLEWCQKNKVPMEFVLTKEEYKDGGRDHTFETELLLAGICCGKGKGYSKKEAHQKAAQEALALLRTDKAFAQSILNKAEADAKEEELQEMEQTTPIQDTSDGISSEADA